ncbi:MAG: hypothetical protein ABEI11_03135 [Haloarculaceae archaeon]
MPERNRMRRRRYLLGLAAAASVPTAGCATTAGAGTRTGDDDRPPCAAGFDVTVLDARIGKGTVPELRLRLRNDGESPVAYRLSVVFRQGTSLGIEARTGRDSLSGRLAAGESVEVTATDDAPDVRNTTDYRIDASVTCPEEG